MRYERRKEFTAVLSVLSVVIAIMASLFVYQVADSVTETYIYITAGAATIAAVAAFTSIFASRRLAAERESRQVFLIYAREDLEAARRLAAELRDNGFNPWLDVDEITPGQVWQRAVMRALEESTVALVLVSEHLGKKGFVQEELKVALKTLQERETGVSPVIPVRLENSTVPEGLSHIQWVDLFEDTGMDQLLSGLNRIVWDT